MTRLTTNSEYTFRVYATNVIGQSPPSPNSDYVKIVAPSKKEAPTITIPLKDTKIGFKQTLTLTCVIGGEPMPDIKWYKNKKLIKSKTITFENRTAKYVIEETSEESAGTYTCSAENPLGKVETSCTVTVEEKATVTVEEKFVTQTKRVHSEWVVTATIAGYPLPEVIWSFDDKVIQSVGSDVIEIETTRATTTIRIKKVERMHTGKYKVEVRNSAGASSVEVMLKVIGKLMFYRFFDANEISKGKLKESLFYAEPLSNFPKSVLK